MKRTVISIDQEKCTGCGLCIPNCPEGAIQIIDGKARLVSDLMCDGLGACLGHCPEEAIALEEREAEPYDERKVMANVVQQGPNTIAAHLEHLREHGETGYHNEAVAYLQENGIPVPSARTEAEQAPFGGCPAARTVSFASREAQDAPEPAGGASSLTHWPIQMHLVSPNAPHYRNADLVLAADCTAYSLGAFHRDYLKGKTLAIACPKLDEGQEIYLEKLKALIDIARINTLHVMIMQVPCCRGLLGLTRQAKAEAQRNVPIKCTVVGIDGDILREEWVE